MLPILIEVSLYVAQVLLVAVCYFPSLLMWISSTRQHSLLIKMITDSDEWHVVHPQGLAAALLGVTIVFSALCTAIVCLRMWVRWSLNLIGEEDWLMFVGLVSFVVFHEALNQSI